MNKWKVAFFVALLAGLVSNAYLFYCLLDSGISYSYLYDSYNDETRRFDALGDWVIAGADEYSKADILHLLRQADKEAFIVEEDNLIHYKGVNFVFESDKLSSVE